MPADYLARIAKLRAIPGVDAVALVPGPNFKYFIGLDFHLSERPIIALVTADRVAVILPNFERLTLEQRPELQAMAFGWTDEQGYEGAFAAAMTELGLDAARLGIDGMTMRYTEALALQKAAPALQLVPVERDLIGIRAIKTPDEIALMRRAVQISEAALGQALGEIRPGMTEAHIARIINELQIEGGAQGASFTMLVQSGPNAANPHSSATSRVLQAGESLLIDFGCIYEGYVSDLTRTFCFGPVPEELQKIHDIVRAANEAGRKAAGPGVPMRAVDKAARDVIEAAGYGDYFTHRTGHGLGSDVHEPIPQIAGNVDDLLQPGMTFTIEPGIYLPGVGGVRIEDNMLITETGAESLSSIPRGISPQWAMA